MKILLMILALGVASVAKAAEPVSVIPGVPKSSYGWGHATLAVSSFSVAQIPASTGYRQVHLLVPTSFFYVLDGTTSSATVVSTGYPAPTANADVVLETNGTIGITLPAGIAANTVRYRTRSK